VQQRLNRRCFLLDLYFPTSRDSISAFRICEMHRKENYRQRFRSYNVEQRCSAHARIRSRCVVVTLMRNDAFQFTRATRFSQFSDLRSRLRRIRGVQLHLRRRGSFICLVIRPRFPTNHPRAVPIIRLDFNARVLLDLRPVPCLDGVRRRMCTLRICTAVQGRTVCAVKIAAR